MSEGRSRRSLSTSATVVVALVAVLASLGVSVAVVSGLAGGVRAVADRLKATPPAVVANHVTVTRSMDLLTEDQEAARHIVTSYGAGFGPMYTNADWSVQAGDTVVVKIRSYDDGPAPLMGVQMMYDNVEGTIGGVETVDGKVVHSVPNADVAHTFTVVGLGLNLPIPAAPTGEFVTVVARFVADRVGDFTWQCYAPCGSGANGMGGPMAVDRWMEGKVDVR